MTALTSHAASLALALIASWSLTAAELTPLDSPASAASLAPRLAAIEDNRAILSWLDVTATGHRFMIAEFDGQRFGPGRSVAEGPRFFANWADTPGVRVAPDGTWLAHWLVRSGRGSYAYDVQMALSSDAGQHWSAPFSPHDDGTLTEHGFVSTFIDPALNSGFGLIWLDGRQTEPAAADQPPDHSAEHQHDSGAMTLRSATITASGAVEHPALLDARVCDCCQTASAVSAEGVVVVYRNRSESEVRDISLIRRDKLGWSDPVIVHSDGWQIAGCPVNGPAVLAREQQVIVAWFTMADQQARVQLALSSDGGRSFEPPMVFDPVSALGRVDLAWINDGFVMSWMAELDSGAQLRLAHFDHAGTLLQRHDLITLDDGRISGVPRLASLGQDRVMLAWTESIGDPALPRVQVAWLRFSDSVATPER